MKIYNWGIVGTGNICRSFCDALAQLPNARIAAVCSRTLDNANSFAARYGAQGYDDINAMAQSDDVDIIYVGTVHTTHIDYTMAALANGKPVLCEKPFALSRRQAEAAAKLAAEKGVFLMEALWTRFLPAAKQIETWISSGLIGDVNEIHATFAFPQNEPNLEGRLYNPKLGGGALLDIGVYPLFLSQWLLGGKPDSFETSMTPTVTGVDGDFTAILRYSNNRKAYISSNFNYLAHQATIIGSRGYIVMPDLCCAHSAYAVMGGEIVAQFNQPLEHGMQYEAAHVMQCLDAGLVQSDIYPMSMTIDALDTCDRLRAAWNLSYPDENRIPRTASSSAASDIVPLSTSNAVDWYRDARFYHIYPLGMCGALYHNDFCAAPANRLAKVEEYGEHIAALGCDAVYFGPLFESTYHGYDTADYYHIDRRLGTDEDFAKVCQTYHNLGIRVIVDGVFNHVGRNFWAFRDVREKREGSAYRDWFHIDFGGNSPENDGFGYQGWEGHYSLVKLNLRNGDVKKHIFDAIRHWVEDFGIDGLRLDVAYCLDHDFLRELRSFCKGLRPDFFLLGECLHGDYNTWCNAQMLDSVTNYECYKGLHSSVNCSNMHEIGYSLNRQFGPEHWTIYRNLPLAAFVDNHDVSRIGSLLNEKEALAPLYALMYAMPGIPIVYYGSEWGMPGDKSQGDEALRPTVTLDDARAACECSELAGYIRKINEAYSQCAPLCRGEYRQLAIASKQLVFERSYNGERVICAFNFDHSEAVMHFNANAGRATDLLGGSNVDFGGGMRIPAMSAIWAHVE